MRQVEVFLGGCLFGANGRQFLEYALSQLHEITGQYLIQCRSVGWIPNKYLLDQGNPFIGSVHGFGDGVRALFDLLVGGVGVLGFEGRDSEVESVEDDSHTPNVYLKVVASPVQDLRSYVVWGTTNCSFALTSELQFGCKSKITDFDVELGIHENVAQFEITVDDLLAMDVLQARDNAKHKRLYLRGGEIAPDSNELIQRLILAELQKDIHILLIFEAVVEFDHVGMVQCFVEFDLVRESESRAVGLEFLLEHDFGCSLFVCLSVLSNEAIGKASFAQKPTFEILAHNFSAIDPPHMFVEGVGLLHLLLGSPGSSTLMLADTHFLQFKQRWNKAITYIRDGGSKKYFGGFCSQLCGIEQLSAEEDVWQEEKVQYCVLFTLNF